MSAFYGLLAIRKYASTHSATPMAEVLTALKRLSPDDAYHDYESAMRLDALLTRDTDISDVPVFFRRTLSLAINQVDPWWARLASLGRNRLRSALTDNETQCFDAAGLFAPIPSPEVLSWWDALAQEVRTVENEKRILQGRVAEQLTITHETERLSRLGIALAPRWTALDDNQAGYDVHSFEPGPMEPIAKLIEVKSCSGERLQIFLTRNEWETAIEKTPNYRFYVWKMPELRLIELTANDISRHVPSNNGNGQWQVVLIDLTYLFPTQPAG